MKVNCLNFSDSKDSRYLFLYGSELIIKQDIADQILQSLKAQGFNDKVSLHQDELDPVSYTHLTLPTTPYV